MLEGRGRGWTVNEAKHKCLCFNDLYLFFIDSVSNPGILMEAWSIQCEMLREVKVWF